MNKIPFEQIRSLLLHYKAKYTYLEVKGTDIVDLQDVRWIAEGKHLVSIEETQSVAPIQAWSLRNGVVRFSVAASSKKTGATLGGIVGAVLSPSIGGVLRGAGIGYLLATAVDVSRDYLPPTKGKIMGLRYSQLTDNWEVVSGSLLEPSTNRPIGALT